MRDPFDSLDDSSPLSLQFSKSSTINKNLQNRRCSQSVKLEASLSIAIQVHQPHWL
jgi:hypothetical protein